MWVSSSTHNGDTASSAQIVTTDARHCYYECTRVRDPGTTARTFLINHEADETDVMLTRVANMLRGKRTIRILLTDTNAQMYKPAAARQDDPVTGALPGRARRTQDNITQDYADMMRGHIEGMRLTICNETKTWWRTRHRLPRRRAHRKWDHAGTRPRRAYRTRRDVRRCTANAAGRGNAAHTTTSPPPHDRRNTTAAPPPHNGQRPAAKRHGHDRRPHSDANGREPRGTPTTARHTRIGHGEARCGDA